MKSRVSDEVLRILKDEVTLHRAPQRDGKRRIHS